MSLFNLLGDAEEARPITPCAICGEPASGEVWGHPLCPSDFGAWFDEPAFKAGAMGILDPSVDLAECERRYTEKTATWIRARKVRAA